MTKMRGVILAGTSVLALSTAESSETILVNNRGLEHDDASRPTVVTRHDLWCVDSVADVAAHLTRDLNFQRREVLLWEKVWRGRVTLARRLHGAANGDRETAQRIETADRTLDDLVARCQELSEVEFLPLGAPEEFAAVEGELWRVISALKGQVDETAAANATLLDEVELFAQNVSVEAMDVAFLNAKILGRQNKWLGRSNKRYLGSIRHDGPYDSQRAKFQRDPRNIVWAADRNVGAEPEKLAIQRFLFEGLAVDDLSHDLRLFGYQCPNFVQRFVTVQLVDKRSSLRSSPKTDPAAADARHRAAYSRYKRMFWDPLIEVKAPEPFVAALRYSRPPTSLAWRNLSISSAVGVLLVSTFGADGEEEEVQHPGAAAAAMTKDLASLWREIDKSDGQASFYGHFLERFLASDNSHIGNIWDAARQRAEEFLPGSEEDEEGSL